MSFPCLKKNLDKLKSNIHHVEENIKRCISYKNSYEHHRKVGNEFINNLQDAFNNQMDMIISLIDDHIKKLKEYINEYIITNLLAFSTIIILFFLISFFCILTNLLNFFSFHILFFNAITIY